MGNKNSKIIKELAPNGKNSPMTKSELINLMKIGENSMVKIYSNQGTGSGFFCMINDPNIDFKYALFTNNHVLDKENIKIGERISLEYKSELKNFLLDENRKVFTNEDLDYTCIEIKKEDNFKDFFLIDENILNDNGYNYENQDILILQFPKGGEISFSEGKILELNKNNILYTASTEGGSSGSPLIVRKNVQKYYVIGIHFGGKENKKCNIGSNMGSILNDLKMKNEEKYGLNKFNIPQKSTKNFFDDIIVKRRYNSIDEETGEEIVFKGIFLFYYYDFISYPSIFEFFFSKKFFSKTYFDIPIKVKDNFYLLKFSTVRTNCYNNIYSMSPLIIITYRVDGDIKEISEFIKKIKQEIKINNKKYELFLIWNAFAKIDKRTISKSDQRKFVKKEEIKYSLEISNKEECDLFFKKLICIILSMKEFDQNIFNNRIFK